MDSYKRLELLLPGVMSADRYALRKELKYLIRKSKNNKSRSENRNKFLKLEEKIRFSIRRKEWRIKNIPRFSFNPGLPINSKKNEIIEAIINNNILIISGETGSGKTTQIPKFCLAAGRGMNGIIGCTQPRRIATISIANRIAEELGENIGKSVGYKIRFDERIGENPFIKIMTDGVLLAETRQDPFLNTYDTIIVDEAHERSINIDFILGLLKRLLAKRRDLKLIITSATIDTNKFSKAFNDAPVIEVSGKMYPVETRYQGISSEEDADSETADYTERAADTALSLLKENRPGDILIFMPTEQDIRETCELLQKKNKNNFAVFPLYARLPAAQQKQIFNTASKRKVIVATNIAETSLTIPNISYVIDTGLARISEYSPSSGIVSMPVKAVSRSSADQRMGRCGRVREGVCIRLYDKEDFEGRNQFTMPEIFRTNLAEVILKMTALGLGDVSEFPFIDKPKQQAINDGYNTLIELGAIQKADNTFSLTEKGGIMAALPLDPRLSRMLLEANERKCLAEVIAIASMLSVQDPRERPAGKENEADEKHRAFADHSSDFLTLLNIWNKFAEEYNKNNSRNKIRKYCRENFMSYSRMKDIWEIHAQLGVMLKENNIKSKNRRPRQGRIKEFSPLYTSIHKSILTGFISNIANKKTNNLFNASKQREVIIFPGSGIFGKAKDWIVCTELVKTSQLFARTAANIKVDWLEELAEHLCEHSYRDPYWDRERADVYAFENVSLHGLEIVKNRRIAYGPVNPADAASAFIREALVEDIITQIGLESADFTGSQANLFQLERDFPFMQHNIELIKRFMKMENRIRKKVMISSDDLYLFYADHIRDAYNINTLYDLINRNKGDDFLRLKENDLISFIPDQELEKDYPECLIFENVSLDVVYKFDPGNSKDGTTVKIPVSKIQSINIHTLESLIPGFYREKITELIKNLPKQYRKHLVPAANTAEMIIREMPKGNPLINSMCNFLHDKCNVEIPGNAWNTELPEHLKLRISVIDGNGAEIKSGRDADALLKELFKESGEDVFNELKKSWEKENIKEWNFGDLPETLKEKNRNGLGFTFYPGLALEDGKLALRIFKDRETAAGSHKNGIAELLIRNTAEQLDIVKNKITIPGELKSAVMLLGGLSSILKIFFGRIIRDYFYRNIRSKTDFENYSNLMQNSIPEHGGNLYIMLLNVLESYKHTRDRLEILKSQNKTIQPIMRFLCKLEGGLNSLIPRDFLLVYDDNELASLEKYTRALSVRAERGCLSLQKDSQKENEVSLFSQALDHEYSALSQNTSQEKLQALKTFFWMIEEYKISVFAPEIKSGIKISKRRLEQVMEEIKRIK